MEVVKTDLQIQDELDAHRRGWAAQRVGLFFIYAMVVAAAAGLFGDGIASTKRIARDGVMVESEKFYRFEARMKVMVRGTGANAEATTVSISESYLQKVRIETIQPEPDKTTYADGKVTYTFPGTGNFAITFYLIPQVSGSIQGELSVNERSFHLKHFIYP